MTQGIIGGVKIKSFPRGKKTEIEYLCDTDFTLGEWRDEKAIKLDTGKRA